jgi:hypothetical protein
MDSLASWGLTRLQQGITYVEHEAAEMSDALLGLAFSCTCVFPVSEISGSQKSVKEKNGLSFFVLVSCERAGVPPIARLCVKQRGKRVIDNQKRPRLEEKASSVGEASTALCPSFVARDVGLTNTSDLTEMAAALASTPTENFTAHLAGRRTVVRFASSCGEWVTSVERAASWSSAVLFGLSQSQMSNPSVSVKKMRGVVLVGVCRNVCGDLLYCRVATR